MKPLRTLIIDDSALARDMITAALSRAPDISIVGAAADPLLARRQIAQLAPDVLTLDVEMPRMDGLAFLRQLMRLHPLPVVMVSSLTREGAAATAEAFALGAVDVVGKPTALGAAFDALAEELIAKVRLAGQAHAQPHPVIQAPPPSLGSPPFLSRLCVLVGGLGCLPTMLEVASHWPAGAPPLLLAPRLPLVAPDHLAALLRARTTLPVHIAADGLPLSCGSIILIPGEQETTIATAPPGQPEPWQLRCLPRPLSHPHDHLLRSLAIAAHGQAIAVLLSGESTDGAEGLQHVHHAGGQALVQGSSGCLFAFARQDALRRIPDLPITPIPHLVSRLLTLCRT